MTLLIRLLGFGLAVLLFCCTSCAHGDELAAVLSQPVDTTVQHQLAGQLKARRIKFNGPVTLQFGGTGNTATTTDASKAKAPVAAAPGAVATATTEHGPPWYLYLGLVLGSAVVGIFVGAYLRGKFSLLSFLA